MRATRHAPLYPLTDLGNAERLAAWAHNRLAWVNEWGWMVWDGVRWVRDPAGALAARVAAGVVRDILTDIDNMTGDARRTWRDPLETHAHNSESSRAITAMLSLARGMLQRSHSAFNRDPWLLNCPNGTLDLRGRLLRPHDPDDLITQVTATPFEPDARCPRWEAFLTWACESDPDMVGYLQRLAGYLLTGLTSEQKLPIIIGEGENGKSKFLGTLERLLGDYGTVAPRGLLMRSDHQDHPTALTTLYQRRLITIAETGEGGRLDEDLVKQLTGEDTIRARYMRGDFFEFAPTAKMVMMTNHPPIVAGTDWGIWRRLVVIPWTRIVAPEHRDNELGDKLWAEGPGILRWALDGCSQWRERGLGPTPKMVAALNAFRAQMDALGEWIEDRCEVAPGFCDASAALYSSYRSYMNDRGERALGMRSWQTHMVRRGFKPTRTASRRQWAGVRLRLYNP